MSLRDEVGHSARDSVTLLKAIEDFRVDIGNTLVGFTELMGGLEDRIKRLEVKFMSLHSRFEEELSGKKSNEGDKEGGKEGH